MKKLTQLRTANDQQLKKIHGTDYTYTETVIQYLRGDLCKDPYAIEQAISDLLATLIDAQQNGHKVAAFFSDDPQAAADNILKELPHISITYLFTMYWPLFMFLLIQNILIMLISSSLRFSLSDVIGINFFALLMIDASFARGIFFNKLSRKTIAGLWILLVLMFVVPFLTGYLFRGVAPFAISSPTLIRFSAILCAINLACALWLRPIFLIFLGWTGVWLIAVLGLALPSSELTVILGIAGIVCALGLLFYRPDPLHSSTNGTSIHS